MKKVIVSTEQLDDTDYLITLRTEECMLWKTFSIGRVLSRLDSAIIVDWLQENIKYLHKLILQIEKEEKVGK